MTRTFTRRLLCVAAFAAAFPVSFAPAAPVLSLTAAGGSANAASVQEGTTTYEVDLHFNSDGNPLSGLQLYLNQDTGPGVVRYGGGIVRVVSPPLAASDLFLPPDATATLSPPTDTNFSDTWFFRPSGEYAQINAAIATYTLDTAALPPGSYRLTPIKTVYSFGGAESPLPFAASGSFTLTVTPVPEPALLALAPAAMVLTRRRVGR